MSEITVNVETERSSKVAIPSGVRGVPGPEGPPGPPGEVTQAELDAAVANKVAHDGTPAVGDLVRVKSINPLVVGRTDDPAGGGGSERPMTTGHYYYPSLANAVLGNIGIGSTNGYSFATPMWMPAITIASIGVQCQGAANATTFDFRLGIYRSSAGGLPDALLIDAGTVSLLTTGPKTAPVNVAVTAGLYWLLAVPQNITGFVAGPGVVGMQNANHPEIPTGNLSDVQHSRGFVYAPNLTGALPATYPYVKGNFGQSSPLIGVGV